MPKYIILYGKFGRHEDAQGNIVGPERGGQLVRRVPGDIVEMSLLEAQAKHDSVRLANTDEIDAYDARVAAAQPQPTPENKAATGKSGPIGSKDGLHVAEPVVPAGKPAPQRAAPEVTAQAVATAPPAAATPAIPTTIPAVPAPAAPAAGKPKARTTGKKKASAK